MNESIIRRFAKYHERHYAITHPGISTDEAITDCAEHLRTTERNVIQTLTRIEDAETLIAEVGAVTSVSDGPAFLRVRARLDILANELLVQAGIDDPRRWREVKV